MAHEVVKKGGPARKDAHQERIPPTPQTVLRHHPDPLDDCGKEMKDLGLEIARIRSAIAGKLYSRAQRYEEGRSPSHGEPLKRWCKCESKLEQNSCNRSCRLKSYVSWLAWLKQQITYPNAVLEIICEMAPPYTMDRKYWLKPGVSGQWVMEALEQYGKMR